MKMPNDERMHKLPQWIKNTSLFLYRLRMPAKLIFLIVSVLSTIWFLIRVIPKPSRAVYPCMQVAIPVMSGFLMWLSSVTVSWLAFRKARQKLVNARYLAFAAFLLVGFASAILVVASNSLFVKANAVPWYEANKPIGTAHGIHPGRVVWANNPKIVTWDGKTGFWWEDNYTNQNETDILLNESLLALTGNNDPGESWKSLFTYFNKTKRGKETGYQNGEKVAVKINQNNTSGQANTNEINSTPQLILSMLKSLIEDAGVPEEKITVFDASRYITDNIYEKCHAIYPDVSFVDNSGGNGRLKSTYIQDAIPYSIDNGNLARGLATCAVEADYLINMAILKGHVGQGVTLCAKNYYGITSIDADWRKNAHNNFDQNRDGSPRYMTFVDFMGHKDLGEKTILFLVDAIYSNKFVNGVPSFRWQMEPFNDNWPSSIFVSQDMVAIDAVCMDFVLNEWPDAPELEYCDAYLKEAALAGNPPSGTVYDPERDGTPITGSLGVLEHWNNPLDKKYSRNLNTGNGIELVHVLCDKKNEEN
jgi:Domain of unknown function (DUF362)